MVAKSGVWKLDEKKIEIVLKYLPPIYKLITKRKIGYLQLTNLDDPTFIKGSKWILSVIRKLNGYCKKEATGRTQNDCCDIPAKNA